MLLLEVTTGSYFLKLQVCKYSLEKYFSSTRKVMIHSVSAESIGINCCFTDILRLVVFKDVLNALISTLLPFKDEASDIYSLAKQE